jgi:hypothetical protein
MMKVVGVFVRFRAASCIAIAVKKLAGTGK